MFEKNGEVGITCAGGRRLRLSLRSNLTASRLSEEVPLENTARTDQHKINHISAQSSLTRVSDPGKETPLKSNPRLQLLLEWGTGWRVRIDLGSTPIPFELAITSTTAEHRLARPTRLGTPRSEYFEYFPRSPRRFPYRSLQHVRPHEKKNSIYFC
ncbi:hypothetical protein BC938DRAFT_474433, partial [Jimgerdemannia flammicorona]